MQVTGSEDEQDVRPFEMYLQFKAEDPEGVVSLKDGCKLAMCL